MPAAQRQNLLLQARKAPLPSGSTITATITLHIVPLRDNGKENGNYYIILGLYRINGKENGNHYFTMGPKGIASVSWTRMRNRPGSGQKSRVVWSCL